MKKPTVQGAIWKSLQTFNLHTTWQIMHLLWWCEVPGVDGYLGVPRLTLTSPLLHRKQQQLQLHKTQPRNKNMIYDISYQRCKYCNLICVVYAPRGIAMFAHCHTLVSSVPQIWILDSRKHLFSIFLISCGCEATLKLSSLGKVCSFEVHLKFNYFKSVSKSCAVPWGLFHKTLCCCW